MYVIFTLILFLSRKWLDHFASSKKNMFYLDLCSKWSKRDKIITGGNPDYSSKNRSWKTSLNIFYDFKVLNKLNTCVG